MRISDWSSDVCSSDLASAQPGADWSKNSTMELIRSRIKVKSLNFMRGRTFMNKFLIIDEAQNLTPKQMKTLVTRAGPGTKIVCLGNKIGRASCRERVCQYV